MLLSHSGPSFVRACPIGRDNSSRDRLAKVLCGAST
jgi:hypothetical protein